MNFLFINVNHEVGHQFSECIPVSMGYILATLKAGGWDGVILDDVQDKPLSLTNLESWIGRIEPQVVGFTAYQSTLDRIRYFCRYVKSRHPDVIVVLGGPQGLLMPSEGLQDLEDVDVLIRGDGEMVMAEMAQVLEAGETLGKVRGITFRSEGEIIDTGAAPDSPEDLDAYPSPYLTRVLNMDHKDTAILLSSRGCSHVCWFCITPRICRGKVRYHSIKRVVDEMEFLTAQGIQRFWFADPNFTEDTARTLQLLQDKIDRGIDTPFWCQTRSDSIDEALIKKLHEAGADTLAFGLESGSPGVLMKTNKGIELEQLRSHVELAHSLGMQTELFSIFGLPGETVEDARQTLEFVRSLGIPIESNSGSQQMQLYFGSIFSKNPAQHGFRPNMKYRPLYRSIGEEYETDSLSEAQMRKIRNLWSLANERIKMDVFYKQRTFEIVDFLLENWQDLEEEPTFHAYGAMAAAVIEEYGLVADFLEGYAGVRGSGDAGLEELISSIQFFKETGRPIELTDRVIFDARSWIEGVPFTSISGKYWDVLLGRGLLLPEFEKGFLGTRPGEESTFTFSFPDDYDHEELQGKEVEVLAKIRKVFRSLEPSSLEEVKALRIANRYDFPDLDLLKQNNEILYYLALRDSRPENLVKQPSHFLMLVHRMAKLGKSDGIRQMAVLLNGKESALNALGDTLVAAGKFALALEFYETAASKKDSSVLRRVRCLLNLGFADEALALLQSIPHSVDVQYQETLLECLRASGTETERIPVLERATLDMRVNAAIERQTKAGPGSDINPVVHGYIGRRSS